MQALYRRCTCASILYRTNIIGTPAVISPRGAVLLSIGGCRGRFRSRFQLPTSDLYRPPLRSSLLQPVASYRYCNCMCCMSMCCCLSGHTPAAPVTASVMTVMPWSWSSWKLSSLPCCGLQAMCRRALYFTIMHLGSPSWRIVMRNLALSLQP